jgi:hypothetical protein
MRSRKRWPFTGSTSPAFIPRRICLIPTFLIPSAWGASSQFSHRLPPAASTPMHSKGASTRRTLRPAVSMEMISFRRDMVLSEDRSASSSPTGRGEEHRRGKLREIKSGHLAQRRVSLQEILVIIVEIDDQPDGDEAAEADQERFDEISDDVTIKELHSREWDSKAGSRFCQAKAPRLGAFSFRIFPSRRYAAGLLLPRLSLAEYDH